MSDFHQFGPVTAIPLLVARDTDEMERRIGVAVGALPGVARDPARAVRDGAARARRDPRRAVPGGLPRLARALAQPRFLRRLPSRARVLRALPGAQGGALERVAGGRERSWRRWPRRGCTPASPGKGRACWLAIGQVLAEERAAYIAFQDADVVNFSRAMLARLVLPAVEPTVDFDFVKAYYARVSDRLHGRVTRLLLTPLLAAFTRLIGQDPYIRYLSSFRYALSGEFAIKSDLAERMRLPCDWGLEIVTLFEALRHRAAGRICQVEIAERYDHKHQALSADDPSRGLNRMARDVVKHLLRTLAAAGVNLAPGVLMSLLAAYQREAEDAVARQPRGGQHQRHRLRPSRGGAHHPGLHPGAAGRDRGVPGRPARPAPRPQLVAGLGGSPRREARGSWPRWRRATRRCGGTGDEPGRARRDRPRRDPPRPGDLRLRPGPPGARRAAGGAACRSSCAAARRGRRWSHSPGAIGVPGTARGGERRGGGGPGSVAACS